MRRTLFAALAAAAIVVLSLAVPLAPAAHAAPVPVAVRHVHVGHIGHVGNTTTPPWCTQWQIVSSPQPSGAGIWDLQGVSAVAANDVWAVGEDTQTSGVTQTLVEHYNGTSWSVVTSPNATNATSNTLVRVVALASNNVWAVGNDGTGGVNSTEQTLVEHYDGSSWSIVSSPNVANSYNQLNGVAADAANDIWAVGQSLDLTSGDTAPLTEHYDGSSWSLVTTPALSSTNYALSGVSVVSGQAFAAGYYSDSGGGHTLVEHYSGGSWSIMTSQDAGSIDTAVAFSPTNVWVAGSSNQSGGLFEHYDGTAWSVVPNGSGTVADEIIGLASIPGTTDLWAVGGYSGTTFSPYAEQWQGLAWNPQTAADGPPAFAVWNLLSVAAVSVIDGWAVGVGINPMTNATQSLIEQYTLARGINCPYP